jgi:heptosyltransferase-1
MPHILLVKTSSLGDVIHNLPVVADICAHVPDARIDWVVEEEFADVPALHPRVERVIPVATRRWRRTLMSPATWREFADVRRRLREYPYDVVLDTQGLLKSAVLAGLARGPVHGQDRESARERFAAGLYVHAYRVARDRHAVVRNRDLAAQVFQYPLPPTPPDYGIKPAADSLPAELPAAYVVCLHGSSRDSKLWPEPYWKHLVAQLARSGIATVLVWGNEREHDRAQRIAAGAERARVLPRLTLREISAVLGCARAVVGVDSGLTHFAVALARPTAAIYTDTSPILTGVYPSDSTRAANLGDKNEIPTSGEVWQALARLQAL